MDLHKAYDALEREICLDILYWYGMGPWDCHILCDYWDTLWMLAHVVGYYGLYFKGFRGVT